MAPQELRLSQRADRSTKNSLHRGKNASLGLSGDFQADLGDKDRCVFAFDHGPVEILTRRRGAPHVSAPTHNALSLIQSRKVGGKEAIITVHERG